MNTLLNTDQIRSHFPILSTKVNGKPLVYFDNAATSQKPQVVIDALVNYYSHYNSNVHRGVHTLSQLATTAYEATRQKVQKLLNAAQLSEIIYTKGTTDAINLVAYTYGEMFVEAGDEIIISAMEHHANIVPWQMLCERKNAVLRVIPMQKNGELILEEYAKLLNEKTKMVAICHVSNTLGTINDVEHIIELAHQNNTPVLIDAAQSVPHFLVDVQALNCDFLVFSAHKLCAPTGVGVLYAQQKWLDVLPPYQGGGAMIDKVSFEQTTYLGAPQRFEPGTPNIADVIAFGAAIDYVQDIGFEHIAAQEQQLLAHATQLMQAIPEVEIIGTAHHKASVISFNVKNVHPYDVGLLLDKYGVAVRTGHHCTQPIMAFYGVAGTCRASFAFYNTTQEVDYFVESLKKVIVMLQ